MPKKTVTFSQETQEFNYDPDNSIEQNKKREEFLKTLKEVAISNVIEHEPCRVSGLSMLLRPNKGEELKVDGGNLSSSSVPEGAREREGSDLSEEEGDLGGTWRDVHDNFSISKGVPRSFEEYLERVGRPESSSVEGPSVVGEGKKTINKGSR